MERDAPVPKARPGARRMEATFWTGRKRAGQLRAASSFGTNMGRGEEDKAGEPETGQAGRATWARGQVQNSG